MRKLPLTAANVWHVAEELANGAGSRDGISVSDVRALVEGSSADVATHFAAWLAGAGRAAEPVETTGGLREMIGELERLVGAAVHAPGRATAGGKERSASQEELEAVLRVALSARKDTTGTKSFLRDVWEASKADKKERPRRSAKPAGLKRRRGPRPPGLPKAERRTRIEARLAAVRSASGAKVGGTVRRVRASDWKGASNEWVAQLAATVLRNTGYPMMPTAICKAIAAAGGPDIRKPGRDLPLLLEGSRMDRVGVRGQIWFVHEAVPERPAPAVRRETSGAHARELAKIEFGKVLDIMRPLGRRGISVKDLNAKLGEEIACFNRDWLMNRLKRAAKDPDSPVAKVKGGFALMDNRKGAAARSKPERKR